MLVELSITPIGENVHMTDTIVRAVQVIKDSGLNFQVTAMGTLIEGAPDAVWAVLRRCHEEMASNNERVITEIRIDQFDAAHSRIDRSAQRVYDQLETASASAGGMESASGSADED